MEGEDARLTMSSSSRRARERYLNSSVQNGEPKGSIQSTESV